MYHVDEDVEFFDQDKWVAAAVTKLEHRVTSEINGPKKAPQLGYTLRLKGNNELVECSSMRNLRMPSLYQVGDEVDFFHEGDDVGGMWMSGLVTRVRYQSPSKSNNRRVPHYDVALEHSDRDIENVLADNLQMHERYRVSQQIQFHQKGKSVDQWVPAIVLSVERSRADDNHHESAYTLELPEDNEIVRINNPHDDELRVDIAPLLDPHYEEGEVVEFYSEHATGYPWVTATVIETREKEISNRDQRQAPFYNLELSETGEIVHGFGNVIRQDIRALVDPVHLEGDFVKFRCEDEGQVTWLDAIITHVEYKQISITDPRQVPCYCLELTDSGDAVEDAFGDLLDLPTNTDLPKNIYTDLPTDTGQSARLYSDESSSVGDHSEMGFHEMVFHVGDRVEVYCNDAWEPGMVLDVSDTDAGPIVYSVRYDDMTSETDIPESRVQGLFTQLGVQVSVRDAAGDWQWGIIVDSDTPGKTAQMGSRRYHVLIHVDPPFDVIHCAPKDVMPFRHIFERHEIVEVILSQDHAELENMYWQRATVEDVDMDTETYTVRVGEHMWVGIKGSAIRPLFMVGEFVRVLRHRMTTNNAFKGEPDWVKGVVVSIQKVSYTTHKAHEVEGHMYEYGVLHLDAKNSEFDTGPAIMKVSGCAWNSCIEPRHRR